MARDDTPGPDSWPQSVGGISRRLVVILGLSLAAVGMAACWLVFDATRPHPNAQPLGRPRGEVLLLTVDRPFPVDGRIPGDPYIGSRACAECHPAESALHSRSGHASTLRAASRLSLVRRLDGTTVPDPEDAEVLWNYQVRDGQLHVARTAAGRTEKWLVDYAFGSGHHATTFVSVLGPSISKIFEHRLTYFARENALGITPGQTLDSPVPAVTPHGHELAANEARKCFRCHTTQMSAGGGQQNDEATMIPNISCEHVTGLAGHMF